MRKSARLMGVAVAVLFLISSQVFSATPAESTGTYLVSLPPGQAKKDLEQMRGVKVLNVLEGVEIAVVEAGDTGLKAMQAKGLQPDPESTFTTMGSLYSDGTYTWGLQAVKAAEAWALGATGAGIRVCILDTGIDFNHPAFYKNGLSIVKGSKNFVADGHPTAQDGNGHGTHVAGTIAGQLNASGSYIGVATGVELYIGRVLGDDGSGSSAGVMKGVDWCLTTVKAHITSMSLGGGRKSATEDRAYTNAYNKGMLTIAAAGNSGNSTVSYPAGYVNVVSVAAVDSSLNRASFSQYNKDVELSGPGVATLSSVPLGTGSKATAAEGTTSYKGNRIEYAADGTVSGTLVECGLGDSAGSCPGKPATGSWIAVVSRGSISFADKHNNVKSQGASAMILTNNDTASPDDDGSFTFGAAGNWLPGVAISYNDGVALRSGGLSTGEVAITAWDYDSFNGTSMATPHVSAVAALAWSAKPALTNATIRDVLQKTARDLGAAGRDAYYGYGLVQADAAVNMAKTR